VATDYRTLDCLRSLCLLQPLCLVTALLTAPRTLPCPLRMPRWSRPIVALDVPSGRSERRRHMGSFQPRQKMPPLHCSRGQRWTAASPPLPLPLLSLLSPLTVAMTPQLVSSGFSRPAVLPPLTLSTLTCMTSPTMKIRPLPGMLRCLHLLLLRPHLTSHSAGLRVPPQPTGLPWKPCAAR
jgi:hypothetical protein